VAIARDWDKDPDQYNEEYFRAVVARTILFREAQAVVQAQDWYTGGFRANIVTYAVAKLSHDIGLLGGDVLDVSQIWNQQRLSEACRKQVAVSSFAAFKIITNPPANSANITQWCKKEECWIKVRDLPNTLIKSFSEELLSESAFRRRQRAARSLQSLDNGIDAQMEVVRLGADYWRELLVWGLIKRLVNPSARALLSLGQGITNNRIPNQKQSEKMLELRRLLQDQGYVK
jgi:hypothetical protein